MKQKYPVQLTETERYLLKQLISSGSIPVRKARRAHILLKSDSSEGGPDWSYKAISEAFYVSQPTISEVRRAIMEGGLESALNRKPPKREHERRLDGEKEAHLIALVCSEPPEGQERWTLRLLMKRLIELEYVQNISHETIRTALKKMNQAMTEGTVVHSTQGQRRVRVQDGRYFNSSDNDYAKLSVLDLFVNQSLCLVRGNI